MDAAEGESEREERNVLRGRGRVRKTDERRMTREQKNRKEEIAEIRKERRGIVGGDEKRVEKREKNRARDREEDRRGERSERESETS